MGGHADEGGDVRHQGAEGGLEELQEPPVAAPVGFVLRQTRSCASRCKGHGKHGRCVTAAAADDYRVAPSFRMHAAMRMTPKDEHERGWKNWKRRSSPRK